MGLIWVSKNIKQRKSNSKIKKELKGSNLVLIKNIKTHKTARIKLKLKTKGSKREKK